MHMRQITPFHEPITMFRGDRLCLQLRGTHLQMYEPPELFRYIGLCQLHGYNQGIQLLHGVSPNFFDRR